MTHLYPERCGLTSAKPRNSRLFVLTVLIAAIWFVVGLLNNLHRTGLRFTTGLGPHFQNIHTSDNEFGKQRAKWTFDAARDRNDHSLSQDMCVTAFPRLYQEIERSAVFWKERNDGQKIRPEQISLDWANHGGLHCMIYDQQLYIISSQGLNHFLHWKERSRATLLSISRAILTSPEPIPNIEFTIKVDDLVHLPESSLDRTVWTYTRNMSNSIEDQVWLIPDFNYWAFPRVAGSFASFQNAIMENGGDFQSKKPQVVWRGTKAFNPSLREALLQQSANRPWSNVHNVDEDSTNNEALTFRMSLQDLCRYKYVVHTEGTSWSSRLKYLLSCQSVVLIHSLTFTTHLYHLLEPEGPHQNYQYVSDGWADLDQVMEDLLSDQEKSRRIADNAAALFRDRYMTPAAQDCYWRRLFNVWSEVTFEPDPWTYEHDSDGSVTRNWRGMTFEGYMFEEGTVVPQQK